MDGLPGHLVNHIAEDKGSEEAAADTRGVAVLVGDFGAYAEVAPLMRQPPHVDAHQVTHLCLHSLCRPPNKRLGKTAVPDGAHDADAGHVREMLTMPARMRGTAECTFRKNGCD